MKLVWSLFVTVTIIVSSGWLIQGGRMDGQMEGRIHREKDGQTDGRENTHVSPVFYISLN